MKEYSLIHGLLCACTPVDYNAAKPDVYVLPRFSFSD
jgi:hypothetical protein